MPGRAAVRFRRFTTILSSLLASAYGKAFVPMAFHDDGFYREWQKLTTACRRARRRSKTSENAAPGGQKAHTSAPAMSRHHRRVSCHYRALAALMRAPRVAHAHDVADDYVTLSMERLQRLSREMAMQPPKICRSQTRRTVESRMFTLIAASLLSRRSAASLFPKMTRYHHVEGELRLIAEASCQHLFTARGRRDAAEARVLSVFFITLGSLGAADNLIFHRRRRATCYAYYLFISLHIARFMYSYINLPRILTRALP